MYRSDITIFTDADRTPRHMKCDSEIFLTLQDKLYRLNINKGNLELVLIDGHNIKISSWTGYPSVILT